MEFAMKKAFGAPGPFPYSPAMRAGDFVFISGQIPAGPDGSLVTGGIEAQTDAALKNLGAALKSAGCDFENVVKVTAFLSDPKSFGGFNSVYRTYFKEPPPARSTVCTLLVVDALVELDAIAYLPITAGQQP
ncbi:MAG: RidA family protein [Variovorax sp.]